MTRNEFFDKKNKGALWDVGVSINRTNPLPLDRFAVFADMASLKTYVSGVLSYPGQIVAIVGETSVDAYLLTAAGAETAGNEESAIKKLASTTASGDVTADIADIKSKLIENAGNGLNIDGKTISLILNPNVNNALKLDENGLFTSITIDKNSDNSYELKVNGVTAGAAINIPKDKVVKSGTVERYDAGNLPTDGDVKEAGTYIRLVFEGSESPVYINVKDLVDVYTGRTTEDIAVNVSSTDNTISANLTSGITTKIDNAVNGITEATLADIEANNGKTAITVSKNDGTSTDVTLTVKGLKGAAYKTVEEITDPIIGKDTDASTADTIKGVKKAAAEAKQAAENAATNATQGINEAKDAANAAQLAANAAQATADKAVVANDAIPAGTGTKITYDAKGLVTGSTNAEIADVNGLEIRLTGLRTDVDKYKDLYDATTSKLKVSDNFYATGVSNDMKKLAALKDVENAKTAASEALNAAKTELEGKINTNKGTMDTHIADTTVHITAEERTKWNGALAKDTTAESVYATTESGGQVMRKYSVSADSNTLVLRDSTGVVKTATPIANEDATTKQYVDEHIATATAGLTGAMHFIGVSTTDPVTEGATVGKKTTFSKGDVVLFGDKEFVYDGSAWIELGDETSYIVKGTKFKNADIADDAAIAQSKISGLTADLAAKVKAIKVSDNPTVENPIDGIVTIPAATDAIEGVVSIDNSTIKKNGSKQIYVDSLNVNKLTQTEGDTLILYCGEVN